MDRYLPVVCVGVFLLGTVIRVLIHIARHGQSGVMLFRYGTRAQRIYDSLLIVVIAILVIQAIRFAVAPDSLEPMMLVAAEIRRPLRWIGAPISILSIFMAGAAQLHLGTSWRIGIDPVARPGLVTAGLYQQSRNPIFFFMLLGILGYVLLLPTWLSLGALVAVFLGIRRQILEEERWLLETYGDEYRAYAAKVGRWWTF